ncbi:TonB-dependent receptor [Pseudomonadales bacterium]|nr:TonB-dependent receptor [Pseudomonadales bacterium]
MSSFRLGVSVFTCALIANLVHAEERRLEEIVVTAEKRESTVSDISISITALGEDMIEDFGIQGADELVNFIPATTRDAFDIRIRGVGRNFRALGGDPGVATYYNGIYSEDFGIAASESGLYDVARIEALRGPQGTLYGRNSIGGALNYITNQPTEEFEGEIRSQIGALNAREFYGILSGPLITDKLGYRLVGVSRQRDGSQDGIGGAEDINTIDDQNVALSLKWDIAEDWEMNVRWNDRSSDRIIGQNSIVNEGPGGARGVRNTTNFARGLTTSYGGIPISAATPGAQAYIHPVSGNTIFGAPVRPGIDRSVSNIPNAAFGIQNALPLDTDIKDLNGGVATNNANNEKFVQNGVQFSLAWDINETTQLKYLGGWSKFDYTFDIDLDATNGAFTQPRQTVLEAVETSSHELQLLWEIGDKLQMTSGLYLFNSDRLQNYAFRDNERFVDPFNYGNLAGFSLIGSPTHTRRGDVAVGSSGFGPWQGDPTGHFYEYWNTVETEAVAVYTQGTYSFSEEWALTVGLRWAEDEKAAFEDRTGYFEAGFLDGALDATCDNTFGADCTLFGITPLAFANILTGAAVPTFGADVIAPTCALGTPNSACATPLLLGGVPFSFADSAQGEETWGDTSFRVNLDWSPNEDTLIYASVTSGYRAGGYSLGIGDSRGPGEFGGIEPSTYDQEELIAWELGYKGTLLDGQMQFNASTYLYSYDNYQDRIELFDSNTSTSTDEVKNVAEAENMGVEFDFMWLATDNLTLGGNGSYTRTEYKSDFFVLEDDNPLFPFELFSPDPTGTDPNSNAFLVQNLRGNDLKRIPTWKATLWGNYDWVLSTGTLSAGATYAYTGDYWSSGILRDLDKVPPRGRLDLSMTWRASNEQWLVRGFIDNVTDKTYARGFGTSTSSGNYSLGAENLYPRYYGIDVTFRFGAI